MRAFLSVGVLLLIALSSADAASWRSEVLLESSCDMGGAAIGDLLPESPGNEVAVVNSKGEVWVVRRAGAEWKGERLLKCKGELIMCAIGDVDPRHKGNEVVAVGMVEGEESLGGPRQAVVLHREGDKWVGERAFEDDHMIHGVAIGDICPRHKGNEVVLCGFNHRVRVVAFRKDRWRQKTVYVANDRMKIAADADILPERPGQEAVVSGSDGKAVVLWAGKLGWHHEIVYTDRAGQSRVAVGQPGILIGGDKGKVTLASRAGKQWQTELLGRDAHKIRGVAVGDVDPTREGSEINACGYSARLTQYTRTPKGFWSTKVVFSTQKPLHHLVLGVFIAKHPGPELLTCGHGGKLIAVYPQGAGSADGK